MKIKTKVCASAVSMLLAVIMLLSQFPIYAVSLQSYSEPVIEVSSAQARPDGEFSVDISFKNNPGIAAALIKVSYDETLLTMTAIKYGEAFEKNGDMPPVLSSGATLLWNDLVNLTGDAVFATLTFQINADAPGDVTTNINVTYSPSDIIDLDENDVSFAVINGVVEIVNGIAGDINMDGAVNAKDLLRLRKYFAGWDVEVDIIAVDCNGDGDTNAKDLVRLRRYMAGHPVEIYYGKAKQVPCNHPDMTATEAKAATCVEDGNIAYWYCSKCHKYFSDIVGSTEIKLADTVIKKTGEHTVVTDPAVAPTTTAQGWTEGSHCSVCGEIIVKPQPVPPLVAKDEYSVIYKPSHNDSYLSTIDFNSQIPDASRTYTTEIGIYELPILEADGYDFVGWFDGSSSQATRITEIPTGSKGNKTLFAHWEVRKYTITFDSPLVTVESIKDHTVNKATALPGEDVMNLYGYRWLGWSDDNGELYSTYPVGKAADVTLHANWQSFRNQAVPVAKLADPKVLEDEATHTYMFTFDLGTIKNVPLQVINDFGKMVPGQPVTKETVNNTVSLGNEKATEIANTVSKSTTKTSTWTLANEWNRVSSASESHCNEIGIDIGRIEYDFSSQTSEMNLTSEQGGSESQTVNWGVNAKVYGKSTTETSAEAKFPIKVINVGVSAKNTTEIGGEIGGHYENTTVNDSYWNTKNSFGLSNTVSSSETTQENLSKHISDSYTYSTTNSVGGSQSKSEQYALGESSTDEYSSMIAYKTEQIEEKSYTTTYETKIEGWWRQLIVGTIHVIGVVAYDMETSTYTVFTYSVLDDKTSRYMDFSKTSDDYNDFESGVIPFEVPYSVNEYISYALGYSEGLEVDKNTGIVTGYTGDAEHIHIPDYYTISNGDGTYTAVKVKGIDPGVFANKTTVKSIRLGKYITEIPENAFNGCTALNTIEYEKLTSIGKKAFADCTSLNKFTVDTDVVFLDTDAFKNVPEIEVKAGSSAIVKNATASGAKSISIYLKDLSDELKDAVLAPPSSTESYALYGRDTANKVKSYSNLRIDSKALSTTINGMRFVNNSDIALNCESDNVTLAEVTVQDTPGFAMKFTADVTNLYLMDKSTVSSLGTNAILTHAVVISKAPGTNSTTSLKSTNGQWLYCTGFEDSDNLYDGVKTSISETSYQQLLNDSLPWVLESEMPVGATIVNRKWTYDQVTNITSDKSFVDGYTLYDTTSKWGDYGPWSGWSRSSASGSNSRQVETKTVTDRAAYTNYRYYIYRSSDGYACGTYGFTIGGRTCTVYDEINLTYSLSLVDSTNRLYGYYQSEHSSFSNKSGCNRWFFGESKLVPAVTHTEYRYRDRELVYTYYHTKTDKKESATAIAESDTVRNVQKWVQYTVK